MTLGGRRILAPRLRARSVDGAELVLPSFGVPMMELQDEPLAVDEALVGGTAVTARATEKLLVPPAARCDVSDGDEGLGLYRTSSLFPALSFASDGDYGEYSPLSLPKLA
ncbi:MAG: hypothetical protein HY271_05200 [Deltaproteobacteria bacterium]|nr:hypothetical protein [Deltaproteobacteria bacterium]